jgi:hypothetical protein
MHHLRNIFSRLGQTHKDIPPGSLEPRYAGALHERYMQMADMLPHEWRYLITRPAYLEISHGLRHSVRVYPPGAYLKPETLTALRSALETFGLEMTGPAAELWEDTQRTSFRIINPEVPPPPDEDHRPASYLSKMAEISAGFREMLNRNRTVEMLLENEAVQASTRQWESLQDYPRESEDPMMRGIF